MLFLLHMLQPTLIEKCYLTEHSLCAHSHGPATVDKIRPRILNYTNTGKYKIIFLVSKNIFFCGSKGP